VRIEQSIKIAAPREDVWRYVSQPERYSEFMVGFRWAPCPGEPVDGIGARFQIYIEVTSIDLGGTVEVIEYDAPHELAWTNITGIDHRGRWILRPRGPEETEVTMRLGYQVAGGILALVSSRVGAPGISRNIRRSLGNLKSVVEGSP
jgi:carbon monoxide dehydrogenase subunit G